jgi:hypothetical protein
MMLLQTIAADAMVLQNNELRRRNNLVKPLHDMRESYTSAVVSTSQSGEETSTPRLLRESARVWLEEIFGTNVATSKARLYLGAEKNIIRT